MKIRQGFVSNSSSSSFTCEICGTHESGWDAMPSDLGFHECENGHVFCESHTKKSPSKNEDDLVKEKSCPICKFEEPSYSNLRDYLKNVSTITETEVFAEVKKVNKRRQKLRDHEYVEAVLKDQKKTVDELLIELKTKFKSFKKFYDSF